MNKRYFCTNDNKIYVEDDKGNVNKVESIKYIEEILQTENNIETIDIELNSINKEIIILSVLIKNFTKYSKLSTYSWFVICFIIYFIINNNNFTLLYLLANITGVFLTFRLTCSILKEYDLDKRRKYIDKKIYLKKLKALLFKYLNAMKEDKHTLVFNEDKYNKIICLDGMSKELANTIYSKISI